MIFVPVSLGELIDKITILEIKLVKITDNTKLRNVQTEYEQLKAIMLSNNFTEEHELFKELYALNLEFWEYHDWQREQWKKYDEKVINIELYKKNREEHILNDRRAEIKKNINTLFK